MFSTRMRVGLVVTTLIALTVPSQAPSAAEPLKRPAAATTCHELYLVSARGSGQKYGGPASLANSPETAATITALTKTMRNAGAAPDVVIHQLSYPAPSTNLLLSGLTTKKSLKANRDRLFKHNLPSYLLQERLGESELLSYMKNVRSACAHSSGQPKLVLVGYSQGALVIHDVLRQLVAARDTAGLAQIAGSVLIADPERMSSSAPVNFGTEHSVGSYGVCDAPRHLHITFSCYQNGNNADIPAKVVAGTAQVCNTGDVVCDTSVLIKIQKVSTLVAKAELGVKIHTNCKSYCSGGVTTAGAWVARRLLKAGVGLQPLTVATTSLPDGTNGESYSTNLVAAGGSGPYKWSATGTGLPSGLTLTTDGLVSGTPAAASEHSITFRVDDNVGETSSRTLILHISEASPLHVLRQAGPAGFASSVTGYTCPTPSSGATMWIVPQGAGQTTPDYDRAIQLPIPSYLPQGIGVYTTLDASVGSYTASLTCVEVPDGVGVSNGTRALSLPFTQTVNADASHIVVTSANDPDFPNRFTITSDGGCGPDPTGNQGINVLIYDATGSSNAFAITNGPGADVSGDWQSFQLYFPDGPKVAWAVQISCAGTVSNDQSGYYYPTVIVPVP